MMDPYSFYSYSFIMDLKTVIRLLLIILIPNLLNAFIWFFIIPKYVGVPYGKQQFSQYLDCTGLTWLKSVFPKKNTKTILFIIPVIFIIYFISRTISGVVTFNYFINVLTIVQFLALFSYCIWQEILYRGIILTMIVGKYSQIWALALQTFITIILKTLIYNFPIFSFLPSFPIYSLSDSSSNFISLFFLDLICSSFISLILGYVYLKKRSLLLGIISIFILTIFLPMSFFIPILPIYFYQYI